MDKIAVITGGASGMGLATARALAANGCRVAVADLDEAGAIRAAAELDGEGHMALPLDVADEQAVGEAFAAVESRLGPVAVLCTFAGIVILPEDGGKPPIVGSSTEDWDRTFSINTRGTYLCVREYLRHRVRTPVENGRVITVSSVSAQVGGYNASSSYIASKGAILSFSKLAAREAAPMGITVNCIAPGFVETPMLLRALKPGAAAAPYYDGVPIRRPGTVEEIAALCLFLASEDAGYITGSCIDINGGFRMQ